MGGPLFADGLGRVYVMAGRRGKAHKAFHNGLQVDLRVLPAARAGTVEMPKEVGLGVRDGDLAGLFN